MSNKRLCYLFSLLLTATAMAAPADYFPPPESKGGWRKLTDPKEIHRLGGMDAVKLEALKEWLLASDDRPFGAVVIRNGYIVLEVERDQSSVTNTKNVKSCAKAICATVLAIASEESQKGKLPRRMSFDDPAFDFIPWAQPLSDPRKARIKVKQLLNHTSGITPEGYGIGNQARWEYILGHGGDGKTASLFFDPGTTLEYSTHGLYHAALVCENVTGKPYDQYAIEALLKPIGVEKWSFEIVEGDAKHGSHASHSAGFPAREMARIAYCMLRDGRWGERQVIPQWFVEQTAAPTHSVTGVTKKSFGRDARSWSHGWELPALEGGNKGEGIPRDARYKPGSGGQLISFVPSLDLVLTRQTGKSGEWKFEEYVRLAAAAVLPRE
jgi:CubicO group peptidase (beta-lactamase class C family)